MHMSTKRRTSILLEPETYERLAARARRHGTTVSDEIRRVLEEAICDENPNQGWIEFAEEMSTYDWKPGPPIGTREAEEEMVRGIYRDSFNREPDW